MNENRDWGAYVQHTHNNYVLRYLTYTKEHPQVSKLDFDALEVEHPTILTAMTRAYQEEQWKFVLDFMSGLKEYLYLQGHWGEAAQRVGNALKAAEHLQNKKAWAHWKFYIGLIQDGRGEYEDAASCYQQSIDTAQDEGELVIQAEAWRRLGWLAHARGERDAAKKQYQRALKLHCQIGDRPGQARDRRQLGILAMDRADFDEAERCLQTSLSLVEGGDDWETRRLQAGAWLDLGRVALQQGRLNEACRRLERAQGYAGAEEDRLLLADIHFHLAILAEEQGDLQEAEDEYQARLKLAKEVGDRWGESSALISLGTLALQQGNYDEAQVRYERVLEAGERHNQAVATVQLGTLAYLQGEYGQALDHLHEALNMFQALNRRQEVASCRQQLGLVAQAMRRWREAEEHYQISLDIRLELELPHDAVQSLYQLGTLAQQRGQREKARDYYQQALDKGEQVGFSRLPMIRQALENLNHRER